MLRSQLIEGRKARRDREIRDLFASATAVHLEATKKERTN
jgi:hypothetical protein